METNKLPAAAGKAFAVKSVLAECTVGLNEAALIEKYSEHRLTTLQLA